MFGCLCSLLHSDQSQRIEAKLNHDESVVSCGCASNAFRTVFPEVPIGVIEFRACLIGRIGQIRNDVTENAEKRPIDSQAVEDPFDLKGHKFSSVKCKKPLLPTHREKRLCFVC